MGNMILRTGGPWDNSGELILQFVVAHEFGALSPAILCQWPQYDFP